uniref:N-acetyltransferase domain-containing protein n=1 Tax=Meloidogyne hapla TaxID=6305 RepID=A0A1I8BPN3_MELHA
MQLVPLIDVPEFIEECIELLNEPPLSVILLEKENKLIGHARLCPLPQNEDGCWIESVIIWKSLRGKGFGKILMKGIELCSKEFGFKKIFLSTTDKANFYIKCGYSQCPPIVNFGSNSKLFERNGLNRLFNKENKLKENKNVPLEKSLIISIPPPPPPPPLLNFNNSQKIYFTKIII